MSPRRISFIFSIVSIVLVVFCIIFAIVDMIQFKNAIPQGITEDEFVQFRQAYAKPLMIVTLVCGIIAFLLNSAASFAYALQDRFKADKFFWAKLIYLFVPVIMIPVILFIMDSIH